MPRTGTDRTFQTLKWLVAALIVAYGISLFIGRINLNLPFRLYVVQSGSMEPSIMTGDLIFIRPAFDYTQNQVITFVDKDGRTVTHRIIDLEGSADELIFVTKGDANPTSDREEVRLEQILGRVMLTVPKIGYLISFGKTRWGSLLFVIVPAVLIIYDEYRQMKKIV